jgi:putative thioredoxin
MNEDNLYGTPSSYGSQSISLGSQAPQAGTAPAASAGELVKDTTTADFKADVIDESMNQPVLVDFWAPWCGPCKQLTPAIEAAVAAAKGAVKLVKMNIDDHPAVAGQLGVQSIPAVFAFSKGQPVDGFMGALPQSEVAAFINKVVDASGGPAPSQGEDNIDEALDQAFKALEEGNPQGAAQVFGMVLQQVPENLRAKTGLGQCYVAVGDMEGAQQVMAQIPEDLRSKPDVLALIGKIELAEQAAALGDLSELVAKADANPGDHQANFDLALALANGGKKDDAVDRLLAIFKADREWQEDGARKQLLKFFEAWGPTDPATNAGRRKLSSALFS